MRRVLPLALLLLACSKPVETPAPESTLAPTAEASVPTTPDEMAKSMGVPVYPGSEAPDDMSNMPKKREDGSTHYSLVLATKDAPAKVGVWYSEKLSMPIVTSPEGVSIVGKTKDGSDLILRATPEAGRTVIRINAIAYSKD